MAGPVEVDLGQELNRPADCAESSEGVGEGWVVHCVDQRSIACSQDPVAWE